MTPAPRQQDPNHVSYEVQAQFDQEDSALFTMTLPAGSAKVEGVEGFIPSPDSPEQPGD